MLIMHTLCSHTLDLSVYTIMRSGAYIDIGFSSAIYVYALANYYRQSLVISSPVTVDLHNGLWFRFTYRLYMVSVYMSDPDLYCYSLFYFIPYDPEDIWSLVQRHQGNIQPQVGGHYDFWIHRDYASILVLAFPMLRRQYQKDLYT